MPPSTQAISIDARVEADESVNEIREAGRLIRRQVKQGLDRAADEKVLPKVLLLAPSVVRGFFDTKATTRAAYVTTRGPIKYDRIAGLLNYGGTVRTKIVPVNKMAVSTPEGPRASVSAPRRYRPKFFLEAAVEASVDGFEDVMLDEVMDAFAGLPRQGER